VGNVDAHSARNGGGSRRVHLPEPEPEFMDRGADAQQNVGDALLCMGKRAEDGDLLFEAPGAAHGPAV